MIYFEIWNRFTIVIFLSINYCNCQRQNETVAIIKIALPLCSTIDATDQINCGRSQIALIPVGGAATPSNESSAISFQLRASQELNCDEMKAENRTVLLKSGQHSDKSSDRFSQNTNANTETYHSSSFFTTSGYFYDHLSNTYYTPDGDYCISSYINEIINIKVCTGHGNCGNPSSPQNTWCVPKCCDINEVFLVDQSRCAKISEANEISPWIPPIYSYNSPYHKKAGASQHVRFQMTGFPKNCKNTWFDNATQALSWFFASSVTLEGITNVKDDVKLVTPSNGRHGLVRPLRFNGNNRKWKLFEDLTEFCVDGFHIHGANSTLYTGNENDFIMVVCQDLPPIHEPGSSWLVKLDIWVSPTIAMLSCVSFLVTIVIYVLIWDKLNLHGLLVLSFNIAALGSYFFITVVGFMLVLLFQNQLIDADVYLPLCYGTAVLSHYFVFAVYLWIVVMSYDLWITFNTMQPVKRDSKQWKVFLLYSLATWFLSFVIITIFVVIDIVYKDPATEVPVPDYGVFNCYVSPYFIGPYVTLPLFILFVINVTFTALAARVLIRAKHQRKTRLAGATSKAGEYSFKVFIRLFIIMGIGWNTLNLMDFVLWLQNEEQIDDPWPAEVLRYIVYLTPIYLCFVFSFNKRVVNQLKDKYPKLANKLDVVRKLLGCAKKGWKEQQDNAKSKETKAPFSKK